MNKLRNWYEIVSILYKKRRNEYYKTLLYLNINLIFSRI